MPSRTRFLPLLLLFASALTTLHAQTNSVSGAEQPPATAAASSTADAATTSTPIVEYAPPPAEYARAKAYSNTRYRHFFINALYGFLLLLVVLRWRLAPAFRNLAERVSTRRGLQLIVFAPLFLLTLAVLGIPSDIWDQSLQRAYGLSVQGWGPWLRDWIVDQAVTLIVGTLLVAILYAVIRRSPRRWWFYFWLASIPVLLALFFLQPIVIDPLFYTFKPLQTEQPVLLSEMQKVVHRGGMEIPADRMFVMNASSKQTGQNAYVTGFGASKRVVVWDNTIAKATIPETLFVFGHEMGHYVLLHIPKEISIDAAILLFLLYVGYRLANGMLARWGAQWGIRDLRDWASLPVLLFVITALAFLATPVFNAVSRHFEHEADRYGLEVIHGIVPNPNQVAAHYFEKSGETNLSDPDPSTFIKVWFYDHPTRPERVHFVATYDPWSKGKTPKYVK
ncbi:MAG: M48 family metallopeptidase [Terriglobales bacterium]|jgi:Zn-dependent protease with chaperone function